MVPWCSTWRPKPRSVDRSHSSAPATGFAWTSRPARSTSSSTTRELAARRAAWEPPASQDVRGFRRLHCEHVLQANHGCDFDFLRGTSGVVTEHVTYL